MSKLGPISHFLSPVSCDSLVLQGLRCEWGAGVLNLVLSLSLYHTGHWKFNMAPHDKELSEDLKKRIVALHKDGVGYKKIAKTLKLSWSTGPRPYSGLTGQVPLRAGLAMVAQRSSVHLLSVISRGCVWEIDVWVLPALLQRLKEQERHKKARKQFAEDKHTNSNVLRTLIIGTMFCGLMRPR